MVKNNILGFLTVCGLFVSGVPGVYPDEVKVKEGDPVTLDTGLEVTEKDRIIKWYYNNIRIAQMKGDLSDVCTDVQCNKGTEQFRDRLKLDNLTGSLTIINTRTTDSGEYRLQTIISSTPSDKIFNVTVIDASVVDKVPMCVKEGDLVTLHTDVKKNQHDRIRWFHNLTRIAQIIQQQSQICTDDECKERFRDRLKLNMTGSLTITDTRTTDSGEYKLEIISNGSISDKTVNVSFCGVSAAEQYEVKEGESVTLDTFVERKTNDVMTWYFHVTLIAEITGDQSKICTDDECKERFRDRLKLDHKTGSLTIINTRIEDAGVYELKTTRSRFNMRRRRSISISISITSEKSFSVSVIDSGLPSGAIAAIVVAVLIVAAAAVAVVIKSKKIYEQVRQNEGPTDASNQTDQ